MKRSRPLRMARRITGGVLLALLVVPAHRLLDGERAGPAAAATRDVAEALHGFTAWGTASSLLAAVALALLLPMARMEGLLERARTLLTRPSTAAFALLLQGLSTALAALVSTGVHARLPRLVDAMAQLLHARAFAAGELAVQAPIPAGRVILNGVFVPDGWVSVYPPGHTALLALGHLAGAAWLVGPLATGVTAALVFLTLARLYPDRPGTARLAGLAVALAPFHLFLGSSYVSHASAAAALSAALYCSVRAWKGAAPWALAAGAAGAFAITSRPWSGLVLGTALTAGVWAAAWWREGRSPGWLVRRGGWALAGALPFGAGFLAYHARLFGHPLRLGYQQAFGPRHGLGFHADPWGNAYGLREALGYTAADLTSLGLHLLETPVSALLPVGLFLLLAPRLSTGTRILLGWCGLAVGANALYWHHGYHLGPRMLFEAGPAWAALAAVSVVGLVEGCRDPGARGGVERAWSRLLPPSVVLWASVVSIVAGALWVVPSRVQAYRWEPGALARNLAPEPGDAEAPLVFVHGSWAGRVAARLVASGMRPDSVETALRRNGLCRVHLHAEARASGGSPPALDLEARAGSPSSLRTVRIGGVPTRLEPGPLAASCAREVQADRHGAIELAPLLWQTALPGRERGTLLYRDLGPAENARVIGLFPARTPLVLRLGPGGAPLVDAYGPAMETLWAVEEGARVSARPGPG